MSDHAPLLISDTENAALLVATLNSFALDYATRMFLGGIHLGYFIIKQLPVPHPSAFLKKFGDVTYKDFIISRVLELTYTSQDLKPFAKDLGYNGLPFQWNQDRRFLIQCELDACFFHLYETNHEDIEHIMETFPIVKNKDERLYGEYRTKIVILKMYKSMEYSIKTGITYKTQLEPAPSISNSKQVSVSCDNQD